MHASSGAMLVGVGTDDAINDYWFANDYTAGASGTIVKQDRVGALPTTGFVQTLTPGDLSGDQRDDLIARNSNGVLIGYTQASDGTWGTPRQIGGGWNTTRLVF